MIGHKHSQAVGFVQATLRHRQNPSAVPPPPQLLLLVHGGPGVGKTVVSRAIIDGMSSLGADILPPNAASPLLVAAPTGIAASNLPGGATLHSTLQFSIGSLMEPLAADKLAALREKRHGTVLLLIDEVSMIGVNMFTAISARCAQIFDVEHGFVAKAFGGLGVILVGDFFQLAPVRDGKTLPEVLVAAARVHARDPLQNGLSSVERTAADLFGKFQLIQLTEQMRAANDPAHTAFIERLRQPGASLENHNVKTLTLADMRSNPAWIDASFIVPTNQERHALNEQLARGYARMHGLQIIRWPIAITSVITQVEAVRLLAIEPAARGIFVQGAPAVLTRNINPSLCLANGTTGIMESLTFSEEALLDDEAQVLHLHDFCCCCCALLCFILMINTSNATLSFLSCIIFKLSDFPSF